MQNLQYSYFPCAFLGNFYRFHKTSWSSRSCAADTRKTFAASLSLAAGRAGSVQFLSPGQKEWSVGVVNVDKSREVSKRFVHDTYHCDANKRVSHSTPSRRGGEGAEFLKQYEFFDDTTIKEGKTLSGIYTYKIYRVKSKMPWILQKLLPDEAFEIHEESWNAYPYCKTILTNPGYMGEAGTLKIESIHLPDNGSSENVS
ncbi:hypothetical protein GCK32_014217 [Trichostrongylus colubriformis]|uniref:Phosphatidylinositol transfer protein N-terminal domain-containing protein n=1 Tax=Trichostrongylus colubriformis TaxID=6319 RepID=A0AAN8EW01_TRICO